MRWISYFFFIWVSVSVWGQLETSLELAFQQTLQKEQILGQIEESLKIYNQLLLRENVPELLALQIQLRIAVCYEKLGDDVKAKELYESIFLQAINMPDLRNFAETRSRDLQKRLQIADLKTKLKELQDSNPKEQLEKEVKELQDKIQTLEKSRPNILQQTIPTKEESIEQKISNTLSVHLHEVGENLYNQGFLVEAKESLQNSLSINPNNEETKRLLDIVNKLIPKKQEKEVIPFESTKENIFDPENILIYSENIYDTEILFQRWKIKKENLPDEKIWSQNLSSIIQMQLAKEQWNAPAYIHYKDKKFFIQQTQINHYKIEKFWEQILPENIIIDTEISMFKTTWKNIENHNVLFFSTTSGIIYASVTTEWSEKFLKYIRENLLLLHQENIYILEKTENEWKQQIEVPLVQGQIDNNYNFQIISEGFQISFYPETLEKIQISILFQKMQRPIPLVLTKNGPFQTPVFTTQQAKIEIPVQNSQKSSLLLGSFLIDGNNKDVYPNMFLFFLFQFHPKKIIDYLCDHHFNVLESPIDSQQETKHYDINFLLQKREHSTYFSEFKKNIHEEEQSQFILNYFQQESKNEKLEGSFSLFQNFLVVHGNKEIHEWTKKRLNKFLENINALCRLKIYMFSNKNKNLDKLRSSNLFQEEYRTGFFVHIAPMTLYLTALELFSHWKLEYTIENIYVGNTQQITYKNCNIKTYIENILWQDNKQSIQASVLEIPQGLNLELRTVLLGDEGEISMNSALYLMKGESIISSHLSTTKKISWSFPVLEILRANLHWKFQKNYFYIISGLESDDKTQFYFVILPEIIKLP
ncbi:MAG TPA: hypothetical protein P5543_10795 [Planctomycetota bacterium]|nr:hypothetical protein [Planctomycetota bacterium]